MDPEFTGDKLLRLVLDIEAAVGSNMAGMTPLGLAVTRLAEDAMDRDETARKRADDGLPTAVDVRGILNQ